MCQRGRVRRSPARRPVRPRRGHRGHCRGVGQGADRRPLARVWRRAPAHRRGFGRSLCAHRALVYAKQGLLFAAPFDAARALERPGVAVLSGVRRGNPEGVKASTSSSRSTDDRVLLCERGGNLARHCGRVRRCDVRHRGHHNPPFADRHHGHDLGAQQFAVVATRRPSKRLE